MPSRKPINPFYVVLVAVGIAFCLTALCYVLLMVRTPGFHARGPADPESGRGLLEFVDRYGNQLFIGELAILAVATVGAIMTDQYWMRRAIAERLAASSQSASSQKHDESSENRITPEEQSA